MKKKVLIIHHCGYIGGAGVSLYHIALALNSMSERYDVEVYCPNNPPKICDLLEGNQIRTIRANDEPVLFSHYNGCNKFILGRFSLRNMFDVIRKKGWLEIKEAIKISNPDIVIVNSMTMCWLGSLIRKMGIKVVCFHRETYAKGLLGFRTKYIKKCLKNDFDGVAFISKHDLQETGKTTGVAKVITDKVDLNIYKNIDRYKVNNSMKSSNQQFSIVYLGGISKLKGCHILVKALAKLKNENVRLIFLQFGSQRRLKTIKDCKSTLHKIKYILGADYEAKILKLINKYSLWNKIEFIPSVTNPEKYILSSDIVVFPSTEAHQARPLYEAGAAQKPIIITEFNQTSEFAIDRFNCLTFKKGNHFELSEKINMLKDNKELYEILIKNNFMKSVEKHDLNHLPMELDKFLIEVFAE
jgi:glycosyltransferase involved in cell wall biosynthesis